MSVGVKRAGALLAAVMLLATACAGDGAEGGEGKGDASDPIVIAIDSPISDLDPQRHSNTQSQLVNNGNVYEALFKFGGDGGGEVVPLLATDLEQPDPTTYEFTLREGVEFQNGEPFNADAAVFSIKRMIDPATKADQATYYALVDPDSIEATGDYSLRLKTTGPDPSLVRALTHLLMVPPELAAEGENALDEEPVGTGPYEVSERSASSLTLTPNDDYWGEPTGTYDFEIRSLPEASARVAGIQTGEIDIAYTIPQELTGDMPSVESALYPGPVVLRQNMLNGLTQDPKVREAITMAIDRVGIREGIVGTEFSADPKCQFGVEGIFGHDPSLSDPIPYDADQAKALFEEAGVLGETLRLVAPSDRYPAAAQAAEAAAAQLEEAGMKVDLRLLSIDEWVQTIYGPDGTGGALDGPELLLYDTSAEQYSTFEPLSSLVNGGNGAAAFDVERYSDVPRLTEEARAATDVAEQEGLLQQAAQVICDTNAFVFLYGYYSIFGAQENVTWPVRSDGRIDLTAVDVG